MRLRSIDRRTLLLGSAALAVGSGLPSMTLAMAAPVEPVFRLIRLDGPGRAILTVGRRQTALNRNESSGDWTLVELIAGEDPFVVLENFADIFAPMLLVDSKGVRLRIRF